MTQERLPRSLRAVPVSLYRRQRLLPARPGVTRNRGAGAAGPGSLAGGETAQRLFKLGQGGLGLVQAFTGLLDDRLGRLGEEVLVAELGFQLTDLRRDLFDFLLEPGLFLGGTPSNRPCTTCPPASYGRYVTFQLAEVAVPRELVSRNPAEDRRIATKTRSNVGRGNQQWATKRWERCV